MKNKKSKYVQLIELYNSGKTNVDELKIELNSTKKTIYTYIYQANKEGKIIKLKKHKEKKRKISKYVQFIELYNLGVTDLDELETEIPLFATQEESEDIQVDEQMTIKIKVKEKEE